MRLVAATLLLIALSMPVQAIHQGCSTSTAQAVNVQGSTFYITTACPDGCSAGVWVYQETNGKTGLQRDDSGHDDTKDGSCGRPDLRIV